MSKPRSTALAQPGVTHMGVWGGSMGAAAGIRAAAKYLEIEALVADSAYPTLADVMEVRVSLPVLRPLLRLFGFIRTHVDLEWMRPVDDIARISPRPVSIIQGSDDQNIPSGSAERLYRAAGEPRFLWVEEGVGHMGMYPPRENLRRPGAGFFCRSPADALAFCPGSLLFL